MKASSVNVKFGIFFAVLACIGLLMKFYFSRGGDSGQGISSQTNAPTPTTMNPPGTITTSYTRNVDVGTNWYNPNAESLRLHVNGNPNPDVGNGVLWQVQARYSDGSGIVYDMPAIDDPKKKMLEIPATPPGKAGAALVAILYRVTPGQSIQHCLFKFQFDPIQ